MASALGWRLIGLGEVPTPSRDDSFETVVLPHLDAAYNLARWLMRDSAAAEDIVQEAMLRALTYFASFKGVNPRAWLLQIVRNAAYTSRNLNHGVQFVPIGETAEPGIVSTPLVAITRQCQVKPGLSGTSIVVSCEAKVPGKMFVALRPP